jgi:hypothetical protein
VEPVRLQDLGDAEEVWVRRQFDLEPDRLPVFSGRSLPLGRSWNSGGRVHKILFDGQIFRKKEDLSIFQIALSLDPASHPLPGLGFLQAAFLAGFEINGMFLDLLDDRFLLNFPLEPAKSGF